MKHSLSLLLMLLVMRSGPAGAHSSTAGYSNEGLKLLKTENIRMAREELFVSVQRIRVRYTFENLTSKPIQSWVAFPFPDTELLRGVPVSEVSDFQLRVGGKRHATRRETVYKLQGREYRGKDKARAEKRLAREKALRDGGQAGTEGFTASVQHTQVWEQVFPPGQGIEVEISYVPSVGGGSDWDRVTYANRNLRDNFCLDAAALRGLDKTGMGGPFRWMSYVLVTGNNWAGPIGQFHLTVEKPEPADILSTCTEGLRKTGPARFELTREDFRPERDLDLIFFHR